MHGLPSLLPQRLWDRHHSGNGEVTDPSRSHHNKRGISPTVYSHGRFYENAPFCCMDFACGQGFVDATHDAGFFRLVYPQRKVIHRLKLT